MTLSGGEPDQYGTYIVSVMPSGNRGPSRVPLTIDVPIQGHLDVFPRLFRLEHSQLDTFRDHVADPLQAALKGLAVKLDTLNNIPNGTRLRAVAAWHDTQSPEAPRWTVPSEGIRLYVVD